MLSFLLLLLTSISVVEITKIEDISICINDTNCELTIYTQIPKVDDTSLENLSNKTEDNNITTTTSPTEIFSRINVNATEQSEVLSTLTSSTTLTTVSLPTVRPSDNKILMLKEKEICECDFTKSSCDINCCCDMDCNHFHLSAFSYCQDYHVELYDSRYCYNQNFINSFQRNNTPFIFEKLTNNLFCILYDNLPPMYNSDNDLVLHNEDIWKIIQIKYYKWKIEYNKILPKYNSSKYYQYGDILWKLHDKSVETIEFLQSGFTEICTSKKVLRYLQNWKGACIQNVLTNTNPYLFAVTFTNFSVIKSLPLFNDTYITKQVYL